MLAAGRGDDQAGDGEHGRWCGGDCLGGVWLSYLEEGIVDMPTEVLLAKRDLTTPLRRGMP